MCSGKKAGERGESGSGGVGEWGSGRVGEWKSGRVGEWERRKASSYVRTTPLSTRPVIMTMMETSCSHTIRQKSGIVSGIGPGEEVKGQGSRIKSKGRYLHYFFITVCIP